MSKIDCQRRVGPVYGLIVNDWNSRLWLAAHAIVVQSTWHYQKLSRRGEAIIRHVETGLTFITEREGAGWLAVRQIESDDYADESSHDLALIGQAAREAAVFGTDWNDPKQAIFVSYRPSELAIWPGQVTYSYAPPLIKRKCRNSGTRRDCP